MSTICDLFGDRLGQQALSTNGHQTRTFSTSCRHRLPRYLLPFWLAVCISGLLPFTAAAQTQDTTRNAPQRAANQLLNTACDELGGIEDGGVQQALGDSACDLTQSSNSNQDEVLEGDQAVAWEEVITQGTFAVEASNRQFITLVSRLRALRLGATGFDTSRLALHFDDRVLPASLQLASTSRASSAGQPSALKQLGVFISGSLNFGEKDATSTEDGFDFNSVGITGGIDYRFTDNFILGLAFGYTSQDADLDTDGDEVEADSYSISLYSTYYLRNFFLDFTASLGMTDYKMTRNIRYVLTGIDSVDKTAVSDTDGTHYMLALGVGYEFQVAPLTFSPYVQMNYFHAHIDSYREQGADQFNLEIGDQEVESLLSILGGQGSYAIQGAFGTLLLQLRAEWRHEFKNDSHSVTARFVNNPLGPSESIRTDNPDRNYFNVAAGVVAALAGGTTVALEYETVLGLEDITNHIVRARLRVSF